MSNWNSEEMVWQTNGWNGRRHGWTDGETDGRTDEETDGYTNGDCTKPTSSFHIVLKYIIFINILWFINYDFKKVLKHFAVWYP